MRNLIYWNGEPARGENQGGLQFLRAMNRGLKERCPRALLVAEDSSAYPGVTRPAEEGGLGFDLKWDLGWMHDTLSYFQAPPEERASQGGKLTFSMDYFANERYLLPLSHDEVVHGKATILQKMYGDYEGKFPQARALYLYMFAHPGKKLNFMGNELGHFREWDEGREQDWNLLDYPLHGGFLAFHRALNHLYLNAPALWRDEGEGFFTWLRRGEDGLFAFLREGGGQRLLAVLNFLDREQDLPLPGTGRPAPAAAGQRQRRLRGQRPGGAGDPRGGARQLPHHPPTLFRAAVPGGVRLTAPGAFFSAGAPAGRRQRRTGPGKIHGTRGRWPCPAPPGQISCLPARWTALPVPGRACCG